MAEFKLITHKAYFVRESSGVADKTTKPTFATSDGIGVVNSVDYRNETEEAVFDEPVGGVWVDSDVKANRDRLTFTIEIGQLSELFWELLRNVSVTLSGGGAAYVPGSTVTHKGWLQIVSEDDEGDTTDTLEIWCSIMIDTHQFAKTGGVTARITGRKLYSTLNAGTFANIA